MFEDFRSWYRAATTDRPQGKVCMFAIRGYEVGVYCARSLGDEPEQSRTGCRFYVYVGRSCEAWRDYHDLDTAVAENPGEPVFDRATVTDILLDQMERLSSVPSADDSVQRHLKIELFRMLRDLGTGDEMVLWSAAQACWSARRLEHANGHRAPGARRSRLEARSEAVASLGWSEPSRNWRLA